MSVDKFKFVSPGIFTAEIDDSRLPVIPAAVGPVVIGRTAYGPAMRPVRVSSVQELERVFGAPNNGKGAGGGDVWRDGNASAPTYATYAAKAFLRNSNPVTLVRVLGTQHDQATTAGKAGWKIEQANGTNGATSAGAYGLFVAGYSGTDGATCVTSNFALAAMFYTTGSEILLSGTSPNGTASERAGVFVVGSGTGGKEFTATISGSSEKVSFSLETSSPNFIRKRFNTDATKINSSVTLASNLKKYFLGETFEKFALETAGTGSLIAFVAKIQGGSDFQFGNEAASTGWVFSQHLADYSGFNFSETTGFANVQKLFRFHSLNGGEWEQGNLKISIENIRASSNPTEIPYGTFDVVVRNLLEVSNQNALERYNGVDLNPNSSNYIARVIGDSYTTWDYAERRYRELGLYPNSSPNIRVEVSDVVENGDAAGLLPFGFYGAPRLSDLTLAKNGSVAGTSATYFRGSGSLATYVSGTGADAGTIAFNSSQSSITISFPKVPLQTSSGATELKRFRWGMRATKGIDTNLVDINRAKFYDIEDQEPSAGKTVYSTAFSLDDVAYSATARTGSWALGNRAANLSLTALSGATTALDTFNKFDLPLFGGFNGNNITEKEPIINNRILGVAGSSVTTNYAYNTIQVALDSVSDPEVVEMNLLTVPGLKVPSLTDKVIEVCEQRGDALAIIDIENDYVPTYEASNVNLTELQRKPNPKSAVSAMKDRQKNSSYGCAFYPAVYVGSEGIFMPASVAALGTFGGTERSTAVWFAPAGFNRGGLNELNSGIGVSRTAQHLTAKERDDLYAVNVNPIASFPAEGVVVFGQKTLQATPSALDRINVRRLLIFIKKQISRFATQVLFDPNVEVTWERFKGLCNPFLDGVRSGFGLTDFRVVLDNTTTTPELVDRNVLYAKILLKPARAIEFIALDFVIKNTGASFDD